jgi:hypothetical protein
MPGPDTVSDKRSTTRHRSEQTEGLVRRNAELQPGDGRTLSPRPAESLETLVGLEQARNACGGAAVG